MGAIAFSVPFYVRAQVELFRVDRLVIPEFNPESYRCFAQCCQGLVEFDLVIGDARDRAEPGFTFLVPATRPAQRMTGWRGSRIAADDPHRQNARLK